MFDWLGVGVKSVALAPKPTLNLSDNLPCIPHSMFVASCSFFPTVNLSVHEQCFALSITTWQNCSDYDVSWYVT